MSRVTVRLSEPQRQSLQKKARHQYMNESDYIRQLIEVDLREQPDNVPAEQNLTDSSALTPVQIKILELLYRNLFSSQVLCCMSHPEENKEAQNAVDKQTKLALDKLLSELSDT